MASQPLRTGLEGATFVQIQRIAPSRQPEPARRGKGRKAIRQAQVFEPVCLCEGCGGGARRWPGHYVGNGPPASRYEHLDLEAGARDRTWGRLVAGLSYECFLEQSHVYCGRHSSEGAAGTTSSVSAAAIAAAQVRGLHLEAERIQRHPDDVRETRRAHAMARAGQDVLLTASERARRRRTATRLVNGREVRVPDYLADVDLIGPADSTEAASE